MKIKRLIFAFILSFLFPLSILLLSYLAAIIIAPSMVGQPTLAYGVLIVTFIATLPFSIRLLLGTSDVVVKAKDNRPQNSETPGSTELPDAWLIVSKGLMVSNKDEAVFKISKDTVFIGSDPSESDISLPRGFIPKKHCKIMYKDGHFYLEQTSDQAVPTFLNEIHLSNKVAIQLSHDDILKIGPIELIFSLTPFEEQIALHSLIREDIRRGILEEIGTTLPPRWLNHVSNILKQKGQVSLTDLIGLPKNYYSTLLPGYQVLHPERELDYDNESNILSLKRRDTFLAFKQQWDRLQSPTPNTEATSVIGEVTGLLQKLLNLEKKTNAIEVMGNNFILTYLETTPIFRGLKIPLNMPLLYLLDTEFKSPHLSKLQQIISNHLDPDAKIILLVFFGENIEGLRNRLEDSVKQALGCDVIPIGFNDIYDLIQAKDTQVHFKNTVLSFVNLTVISPYTLYGPAAGTIFFGRETELRQITENIHFNSYAITGGRRVGKTSILYRLHQVLLPVKAVKSYYHDCAITPDIMSFLSAYIYVENEAGINREPITVENLLNEASLDEPMVLLLDEADRLITTDRDNQWKLFNLLRSLKNKGRIQFIFAGERALQEAVRDSKSPFFNFANELPLGCLDFPSMQELVLRPMKQLGVSIEDEPKVVQRIYEFTSGHPNVVQRLCQHLVIMTNTRTSRRLTLEDVEDVVKDVRFQRYDFLETFWGQATLLERILSILLSQSEADTFTLKEVQALLERRLDSKPRARQVDLALRRLVDLRSILAYTPQGYAFAVKSFPVVINQPATIAPEDLLEQYLEEYRDYGDRTLEEIDILERNE